MLRYKLDHPCQVFLSLPLAATAEMVTDKFSNKHSQRRRTDAHLAEQAPKAGLRVAIAHKGDRLTLWWRWTKICRWMTERYPAKTMSLTWAATMMMNKRRS